MGYRPGLVVATAGVQVVDIYGKTWPSFPVPVVTNSLGTDINVVSMMLDVAAGTSIARCSVNIAGTLAAGTITLSYAQLDVASADGLSQLTATTASTPTLGALNVIEFDDPSSGATVGTDLSMTAGNTTITSAAGGRYQFQLYVGLDYAR